MGQSPIKLTADTALRLNNPLDLLTISYQAGPYPGAFKGDRSHGNFELKGPPFPLIRFRKRASQGNRWRKYKLLKVHIHKPSEHLVERDDPADFEVHFLHVPKRGTLDDPKVVIGILFSVSETAPCRPGLSAFGPGLPSRKSLRALSPNQWGPEGEIDPLSFFPIDPNTGQVDLVNWFSYEGSLTSYPYSEDVTWFVMKNRSLVSPADVEALECYAEQETRQLQPLDRRIVVRSF